MDEITKHPLQQLCEDIDLQCRSYSGRGMYGKECLGIDVDRLGPFIASIISGTNDQDGMQGLDASMIGEIAEAFERMATDQMGMGTIVYFPDIPYVGDEGETDDAEPWGDEGP